MSSEKWSTVKELFGELSVLPAEAQRTRLADIARSNPDIAREVADLIQSTFGDDGSMTAAVLSVAGDLAEAHSDQSSHQLLNQRIGRYRITEHLAQGGMGNVFLAERDDGAFEQRVAIKLLRKSFQSDDDRRRFAAERQMLAKLDHPNIAKVLDGGNTDDGTAYLTMEYVDGKSIVSYCVDNKLSLHARLELFRKICDAVDFAHRNLIVHRDIKPSNILVTRSGEPKLLDFGIAKLLDEDESNEVTELAQRALTPDYASPEQVLGQPITTTSDVYSLGVLLYELTTGKRPYTTAGLRASEREQVICSKEPEKPSVSAWQTRRAASEESAFKPDPSLLKGDLDAIVLTALHKIPSSRYASARELSRELQRYLDGMPVQARGRHWNYLLQNFVRRHALAVAASLALVGTGVTAAVYHNNTLTNERDRATQEADKARAIATFLTDIFNTPNSRSRGVTVTAKEVIDAGAEKLKNTLVDQPATKADLLRTIGDVYASLGQYDEATTTYHSALELYEASGNNVGISASFNGLGNTYRDLRDFGQSIDYLQKSVALVDGLTEVHYSKRFDPLLGLANVYAQQGNMDGAERAALDAQAVLKQSDAVDPFREAAVETLVGQALHFRGEFDEAERLFRSALQRIQTLYPTPNHTTAVQLNQLASVLRDKGDLEAAEPLALEALEIDRQALGPDHPELDNILSGIGWLYREMGRTEDARSYLQQALDHSTRTRGARTFDSGYHMHNLAKLLVTTNEPDKAESLYVELLSIYAEVLEPDNPFIASSSVAYGSLLLDRERPAEALEQAQRALDIARGALPEGHWLTADALHLVGASHADLGDAAAAEDPLRDGFLMLAESRPEHPSVITAGNRVIDFYAAQNNPNEVARYRAMVEELRLQQQ